MKLKDWNYKFIYASKEANKYQDIIKNLFYNLYYCYLNKAEEFNNTKLQLTDSEENLYNFIKEQPKEANIKRTIIDYIAGQTDQYFLNECLEHLNGENVDKLYK